VTKGGVVSKKVESVKDYSPVFMPGIVSSEGSPPFVKDLSVFPPKPEGLLAPTPCRGQVKINNV
jgi:hypothetical protein